MAGAIATDGAGTGSTVKAEAAIVAGLETFLIARATVGAAQFVAAACTAETHRYPRVEERVRTPGMQRLRVVMVAAAKHGAVVAVDRPMAAVVDKLTAVEAVDSPMAADTSRRRQQE